MSRFIVAANWKMHKSPAETVDYFKEFLARAPNWAVDRTTMAVESSAGSAAGIGHRNEVIFFVPAIDLWVTREALSGSRIGWGAQNCYFATKGAFTGENSPMVLADIGAKFALVGHSERRALFGETDEETAKKVKILDDVGITPMLCVGETLNERELGQTEEVIVRQLRTGLSRRNISLPVIIAYEPVWAIGTGKVATPEQAGAAHSILRQALADIDDQGLANVTPILYGGSVKPDNAKAIAAQKNVDGFLVGGASLEVASFLALCQVTK